MTPLAWTRCAARGGRSQNTPASRKPQASVPAGFPLQTGWAAGRQRNNSFHQGGHQQPTNDRANRGRGGPTHCAWRKRGVVQGQRPAGYRHKKSPGHAHRSPTRRHEQAEAYPASRGATAAADEQIVAGPRSDPPHPRQESGLCAAPCSGAIGFRHWPDFVPAGGHRAPLSNYLRQTDARAERPHPRPSPGTTVSTTPH